MTANELLNEALPYLAELETLHSCGATPCMSTKDARDLRALIDNIWELLREEERNGRKK